MLDETTTGQALRRLRELSGMSDRVAARRLGVSRSELRDWEAHRRRPDADQLARCVEVYGQDVESALAIRTPLTQAGRPGVLVIGDEEVVIADHLAHAAGSHAANEAVLGSYLAAVRRQRGLPAGSVVHLRSADIGSLAIELDLTDDHLQELLAELLDLTPAGAQYTARALLVGALVAVMATGLVQSSWFTPNVSASPAAPAAELASPIVEARAPLFHAGDLGPTERGPLFSVERTDDAVDAVVDEVIDVAPIATDIAAAPGHDVAPPMPHAEVTPDEVPYAIFSVDPVERPAVPAPTAPGAPNLLEPSAPSGALFEERASVFSVTPRDGSVGSSALADTGSAPGDHQIPALGPGSPELPPAD